MQLRSYKAAAAKFNHLMGGLAKLYQKGHPRDYSPHNVAQTGMLQFGTGGKGGRFHSLGK
jgi:hypothetical protein